MSQKTYLIILRIGIYLSFLSVFLVFKNLLFPFITSKQIYFNILIEILFVFWLVFIIQYPSWRPKKSWISIGLVGFFITLIASCFAGVDFNLSFWGDIERMLGVFHLLHFLVFYFIIITVFKEWKDWRNLLIVSIVAAALVSFNALVKDAQYSTIGNTAYVSGYLIFNMYFALLLFFKEKNSGGWRWLYITSIPIMLLAFQKAGTTGAHVGLGLSIIVLLFLYAILNKNKKIRAYTLIFSVLLIAVLGLSFANKDSDFISKIPVLKVVREVNFQKNTFQTRLISWRAAAKDFKEHPILGTGHGNFAIIFDKHFEPTFYDYTRSETYFDRAHNNIIDIASTTGALGLLTYLSIFIAVGYYLIKGYKEEKININEFILLTCLIIAYFVQNLAVFDSLVTYVSLMVTLGFIYYLSQAGEESEFVKNRQFNNKEIFVLFGVGLAALIILFQCNIRTLQMLKGTIDGQIAFAQNDIIGGVEIYKKALSYNTILDRDSRDSLVRAITARWAALNGIDRKKAQEILDYAIEMCKKNIQYNPQDSLIQTELAQILNITAQFNKDNSEKFYFYSDQAMETIDKAINASPKRIPIYYSKAQIYAIRGENDKAIETLEYAAGLNEKYYDSFCNLARYHFIAKNKDRGFEAMDKCLDLGGVGLLSPEDYVTNLINYYVAEKEDWPRVLKLYQRMSQLKPSDPKIWV
ncbi:O-antigen ligase family protein, partial [Candidatus Parcubacteria bacterium]|nr:O-antigen ligase family protein [Candidatus Parcubacteria bacterium]